MPASIIKVPLKNVYVDSYQPTTNHGGYYALFLGLYANTVIHRDLFQFDLSILPSGQIITKAELVLYIMRNDYPSASKLFNIYRIRQNFEENTVTYNNQPSVSSDPYATLVIDDEINTYLRSDVTDLVKEWYEGHYPNHGLLVKASNETINSLAAFYSSYSSNEVYFPYLEISIEGPEQISGRVFSSSTETELITSDSYSYSQVYDVSQTTNYTVFVKNTGDYNYCDAILQISPNSIDWINDSKLYSIMPGEIASIVPRMFSQYARLAYKSSTHGSSTTIDVCAQLQV